jgi:hypothetical protein
MIYLKKLISGGNLEKIDKPSLVIDCGKILRLDVNSGTIVYWGDGSSNIVLQDSRISHTYLDESIYTIKIYGIKSFFWYPRQYRQIYAKDGDFQTFWPSSGGTYSSSRNLGGL